MMEQAIREFNKQFAFKPEIKNKDKLIRKNKIIVCGMGGSHLAADILQGVKPRLHMVIHEDYGLPKVSATEYNESLVILSSYSGNTEEVIDAYLEVKKLNLACIVISVGGKLIELAQADKVPYIEIPETGIQPRSALGYSFLSFLKAIGEYNLADEAAELAKILKPENYENEGKRIAELIKGRVPVIYSSRRNYSISYNWKIKLNETGKIPAFYNLLPELNHNEINGFDVKDSIRDLTSLFYFIFIKDIDDDPRVIKRMEVLEKMYQDRDLSVEVLELVGTSRNLSVQRLEKIFNSLILGDWVAFCTAGGYDLESEQVPMVEEFKKLIK